MVVRDWGQSICVWAPRNTVLACAAGIREELSAFWAPRDQGQAADAPAGGLRGREGSAQAQAPKLELYGHELPHCVWSDRVGGIYAHFIDEETEALPSKLAFPKLQFTAPGVCLFPLHWKGSKQRKWRICFCFCFFL